METETQGDEFDSEDPSEEKKIKIVRAVLLFAFLVITVIAVYTTVILFGGQENQEASLSPPDAALFVLPEEENPEASFDIEQKSTNDKFSDEEKVYKDEPINPSEIDPKTTITPLVIYDEERVSKERLVWALVLIEVFVIFAVYRKIDKFFSKKRTHKNN